MKEVFCLAFVQSLTFNRESGNLSWKHGHMATHTHRRTHTQGRELTQSGSTAQSSRLFSSLLKMRSEQEKRVWVSSSLLLRDNSLLSAFMT